MDNFLRFHRGLSAGLTREEIEKKEERIVKREGGKCVKEGKRGKRDQRFSDDVIVDMRCQGNKRRRARQKKGEEERERWRERKGRERRW